MEAQKSWRTFGGMGTTADGQRVYSMGECTGGRGDEGMKIGSSVFSD